MNENKTEYFVDYDSITGEGNVEIVYHKNFLKVISCESM